MKLRIYPQKTTVLEQFNDWLKDEEMTLSDNQTALDKLNNSPIIANAGAHQNLERMVQYSQNRVLELKRKIALIESHKAPEVAIEIVQEQG